LVRLGQELGVEVTAEGIETPEELAAVRASGCSDGQGFLLGQPVAHPAFKRAPAWSQVDPGMLPPPRASIVPT
jgi:EAL domain-containing protein (putative c-di-GMP-specific phosphodiesterase class I)